MTTEPTSSTETLPATRRRQITPFHIRAQLGALFFGPGSLKHKFWSLLTESWSPWRLRERFIYTVRSALHFGQFHTTHSQAIEALAEEQLSVSQVIQALEKAGKNNLHIGLIADGNRRFGKMMGKGLGWGHVQGARVIRDTFLPLISQIPQISECSLYLLSDSNLKGRPEPELQKLDQLFQQECKNLLELATKHNIKYHHAGNLEALEEKMPGMAAGLQRLIQATANNDGLIVNLCLNYQAKTEVGEAIKWWALQQMQEGVSAEALMEMDNAVVSEAIRKRVWIPKPMDLCVRTGGDRRISGFPPNQAWNENCELVVLDQFLPQIDDQHILKVLLGFAGVELRKGQ